MVYYIRKELIFMKKEISKFVGGKIRSYRKRNKLTQKELVEIVGVKHNTISSYESGTTEPVQDALFKMADVFGIKVDDFFPIRDAKGNSIHEVIQLDTEDLNIDDLMLIKKITEKALSLDGAERKKLMKRNEI